MKTSKLAELIEHISKTSSPMNSRMIETIDSTIPKQSRRTVNSERKAASIRMKSNPGERDEI